ncbi:MAG: 6,7-dimethyl-8-ribityllumazine synthase, partial [Alphaproteobacteria bacterium]
MVKLNKIIVAIILSDYYEEISEGLLAGAIEYCVKYNLGHVLFRVPGALEIGSAIKIISEGGSNVSFNGFIALGCVIRGETSHFEIVINESSRALTN